MSELHSTLKNLPVPTAPPPQYRNSFSLFFCHAAAAAAAAALIELHVIYSLIRGTFFPFTFDDSFVSRRINIIIAHSHLARRTRWCVKWRTLLSEMRSVFSHCRRFRAWHELRGWWVHALDVAAMFGSRDTYANDLCLSEFRNKNREFIFLSRVVGACVVRYVCGERRTSSEGLKKLHFGLKWIRCAVAGLGVVVVSNSAHALNAHAFQCFESQATFMTYWNFYSRVAIESNRNHWVFWTRIDFSCGYSKWSGLRLNFTLQPSPTNKNTRSRAYLHHDFEATTTMALLCCFSFSRRISGMLDEIHELNIRLEVWVWRADSWSRLHATRVQ